MNIDLTLKLLSLIGIPSIFTIIISVIWHKLQEDIKRTKAVQTGVQALLRDRLYQQYNKALERGYAKIYEKENFNNCYIQYHSLGTNGVMDNIYKEMMSMPTQPAKDK